MQIHYEEHQAPETPIFRNQGPSVSIEQLAGARGIEEVRIPTGFEQNDIDIHGSRNSSQNKDGDLSGGADLNLVDALCRGHFTSTKDSKEFTILLVGETGVGKTSILSLFYNVLHGYGPDQYTTAHIEAGNETGGSQAQSQTREAMIYEIYSVNGFKLRILDTPGLADTRGLTKDQHHKKSIAEAIQRSVATVNAVLILTNGTNPRLGIATDYALTTLTSIFPRSLVDNICIVFTNVSNPTSCNFDPSSLPDGLKGAEIFMIDNPVAKQKRLKELFSDPSTKSRKFYRGPKDLGPDDYKQAVETIAEILGWIDNLDPQPTKDILTLYKQSQDIERNIINALERTRNAMDKKSKLTSLVDEIESASVDIETYRNFKKTITKQIHIQKGTDGQRNTYCVYPQCYHNCHMNCSRIFSLFPRILFLCSTFEVIGGKILCEECGHGYEDHRTFNSMWELEDQKEETIDCEAEARFLNATSQKSQKQLLMNVVEQSLKRIEAEANEAMRSVMDLAESYSNLALGGSLIGQIEKSIRLLETNLESLGNDPIPDRSAIDSVRSSLEKMVDKHQLLKLTAANDPRRGLRQGVVQAAQSGKHVLQTGIQFVTGAMGHLGTNSRS